MHRFKASVWFTAAVVCLAVGMIGAQTTHTDASSVEANSKARFLAVWKDADRDAPEITAAAQRLAALSPHLRDSPDLRK